jgi:hypothetical protein
MFLPIPFIGLFKLGKRGTAVFPAAQRIGVVARILAVLPWLCIVGGFGSLIWTADGPYAWHCLLGGLAGMYVFFSVEWLGLRRVRIVRIGMSSLEVRFAWQGYAEEFCRIKDFDCREKPMTKRPTPVVVSGVG